MVPDIGDAEGEFELILESAGGSSLERSIGLVAPRGTIVVFGNSSGAPATISFADFRAGRGPESRPSSFTRVASHLPSVTI